MRIHFVLSCILSREHSPNMDIYCVRLWTKIIFLLNSATYPFRFVLGSGSFNGRVDPDSCTTITINFPTIFGYENVIITEITSSVLIRSAFNV